jgi:hypothetical protein
MKKLLFITFILSLCSFGFLNKRAAIPQSTTLLNSDVIILGKVSKIDTTGFFVAVEKLIINNSSDKKYSTQKEIFINLANPKKARYSYIQIPELNSRQIFTSKYDSKTNKLSPTDYNCGLNIDKKDSIYIIGNNAYKHFKTNDVVAAIKLLHNCYSYKKEYFENGFLKSKVTSTQLNKTKKSSPAAKIWIDDIETRNGYSLKNR